jgi:hypothetical protein
VTESPATPAKRTAFSREDKRLIIDVSDESDNDVDMDVISPANGAHPPGSTKSAADRQHTAAAAAPAPNPQLVLMTKQIEEMKKRIAVAEALKKSKKASAEASAAASRRSSRSPPPQLPPASADATTLGVGHAPLRRVHTSTDVVTGMATPPPVVVKGRTATPEDGGRGRATSASQPPTAETTQVDKRSRLEQLRLEIARLQGEVDEDDKKQEVLKMSASADVEEGEAHKEDDVNVEETAGETAMSIKQSVESMSEAAAPVATAVEQTVDVAPATAAVIDGSVDVAMEDAVDAMEARKSPAAQPDQTAEPASRPIDEAAGDVEKSEGGASETSSTSSDESSSQDNGDIDEEDIAMDEAAQPVLEDAEVASPVQAAAASAPAPPQVHFVSPSLDFPSLTNDLGLDDHYVFLFHQ